jgi:hypothetical protein
MAASKLTIAPEPTIKDVVAAIQETHECLNTVGANVVEMRQEASDLAVEVRANAEEVCKNRRAVVSHNIQVGERIARIEGALGIGMPTQAQSDDGMLPKTVSRRFAGLSPWQAFLGVVGAAAGAQIILKALEPALGAFFSTLYHGFMH